LDREDILYVQGNIISDNASVILILKNESSLLLRGVGPGLP
jgi:hypothetical protein